MHVGFIDYLLPGYYWDYLSCVPTAGNVKTFVQFVYILLHCQV